MLRLSDTKYIILQYNNLGDQMPYFEAPRSILLVHIGQEHNNTLITNMHLLR